jgi:ATPase subunit of ABC transporter with duplicated ATPase domains
MLKNNLTVTFQKGWAGVVGANSSDKSTILKLATGNLKALKDTITSPGLCRYRTFKLHGPSLNKLL